jgi:LacI family transcriptional regulator
MRRLLDGYPEMDAVFVANDQMALGALRVLCLRGMRVPQDLAMVGFDGLPEAAYYCPPLTTVYQDQQEVGHIAVSELVQAVEAKQEGMAGLEPRTIWLEPKLTVRESSMAPAR